MSMNLRNGDVAWTQIDRYRPKEGATAEKNEGWDEMNKRELEELQESIMQILERRGWTHKRFYNGNRYVDEMSKTFGGMLYRYLFLDDGMYSEFWMDWVDEEEQEWITLWFADWDHIIVHPARPIIYATIEL